MSTETLLLTGGAGFLGAHVLRNLLTSEHTSAYHLVVLDDLSGGFLANLPNDNRVTFINGSVCDVDLVNSLFEKYEIREIYHLAAYAAEGLSHFIRRFNYQNNLTGSINLVNNAVRHGVRTFVFTSSIAVYGAAQTPMTESTVPIPEDPYGIAKYAVELDLKCAHEMFGLDYVIFRPHNVYGEYQNIGDRYRNVVGIFMNQILQGQPMTIFGNGEQKRAFTYVGDIAGIISSSPFISAARNQVFNVGADTAYCVNELASKIATSLGVDGHAVKHLDARNEVEIAFSDHSLVREVFGRQDETSLEVGLAKMAEWVHSVGARESPRFKGIEIETNLPPSWK